MAESLCSVARVLRERQRACAEPCQCPSYAALVVNFHKNTSRTIKSFKRRSSLAPRAALTNAHFQLCLMIRRQHFALTRGCAPLPCGGAHVACQRLCRGAKLPPLRCTARHAAEPRSKALTGRLYCEQDEVASLLKPKTLMSYEQTHSVRVHLHAINMLGSRK